MRTIEYYIYQIYNLILVSAPRTTSKYDIKVTIHNNETSTSQTFEILNLLNKSNAEEYQKPHASKPLTNVDSINKIQLRVAEKYDIPVARQSLILFTKSGEHVSPGIEDEGKSLIQFIGEKKIDINRGIHIVDITKGVDTITPLENTASHIKSSYLTQTNSLPGKHSLKSACKCIISGVLLGLIINKVCQYLTRGHKPTL